MKLTFYLLPVLFLLQSFALHKYYVSVTEIHIEKKALQIIMRTFPDDMERAVEDNYHIQPENPKFKQYMEIYLREHFQILIDGQDREYKILGSTDEDNFLVFLLESKLPPLDAKQKHQLQIKNSLLTDIYDDQKNIVHLIKGNKKTSFILNRQNISAKISL